MFPAFLLQLVVVLIICGLLLWIVQQIPMDAAISRIIRVVVIVFVVLWLCWFLLGLAGSPGPLFRR